MPDSLGKKKHLHHELFRQKESRRKQENKEPREVKIRQSLRQEKTKMFYGNRSLLAKEVKTTDLYDLPWATGIFKFNLGVFEYTGPKNNMYFYWINNSKLLYFCKIDLDIFINLEKCSGYEQRFNCPMNYALYSTQW